MVFFLPAPPLFGFRPALGKPWPDPYEPVGFPRPATQKSPARASPRCRVLQPVENAAWVRKPPPTTICLLAPAKGPLFPPAPLGLGPPAARVAVTPKQGGPPGPWSKIAAPRWGAGFGERPNVPARVPRRLCVPFFLARRKCPGASPVRGAGPAKRHARGPRPPETVGGNPKAGPPDPRVPPPPPRPRPGPRFPQPPVPPGTTVNGLGNRLLRRNSDHLGPVPRPLTRTPPVSPPPEAGPAPAPTCNRPPGPQRTISAQAPPLRGLRAPPPPAGRPAPAPPTPGPTPCPPPLSPFCLGTNAPKPPTLGAVSPPGSS